jgi:hypothetical protein
MALGSFDYLATASCSCIKQPLLNMVINDYDLLMDPMPTPSNNPLDPFSRGINQKRPNPFLVIKRVAK